MIFPKRALYKCNKTRVGAIIDWKYFKFVIQIKYLLLFPLLYSHRLYIAVCAIIKMCVMTANKIKTTTFSVN